MKGPMKVGKPPKAVTTPHPVVPAQFAGDPATRRRYMMGYVRGMMHAHMEKMNNVKPKMPKGTRGILGY